MVCVVDNGAAATATAADYGYMFAGFAGYPDELNVTAKDATTVELTFDGSSAEATLEGEELVMQQDGDVMRFKRGEIPPAASEVQRDENQAAEPEA